jgi:hypothetical protein
MSGNDAKGLEVASEVKKNDSEVRDAILVGCKAKTWLIWSAEIDTLRADQRSTCRDSLAVVVGVKSGEQRRDAA